jgi:hypothetical protein
MTLSHLFLSESLCNHENFARHKKNPLQLVQIPLHTSYNEYTIQSTRHISIIFIDVRQNEIVFSYIASRNCLSNS